MLNRLSDFCPTKGESRWDRRFPIPPPEGAFQQSLAAAHFLYQAKCECHFLNGTWRVRYLQSYIYHRQEYLRFNSVRGEIEAVTSPWQSLA
ncbi:HLA class II histocompatibility antigen DR beta 5 chain-like [Crotalus adamanteus]|uniref:HLA class II histocompatibility antigen DR beta 5 chain-like n=1 Tax=Crotalus adamanteus TaxID=8729 RepID=A0AAW1BT92_CROAD